MKKAAIKPILLISLPCTTTMADHEIARMSLYENDISNDYHILVIISNSDETDIRVIFEKDFEQVNFDELKGLIKNNLKQKL